MSESQAEDQIARLVSSIKKRSTIKDPTSEAFRNTGVKAATIINEVFNEFNVFLDQKVALLDFGCGSGRVALPLVDLNPSLKLTAIDVDAEAIEYLSHKLPHHCRAIPSQYTPPTSFPDDVFDAAYAISVWSHFPEDLGSKWLCELHRIIKPGGVIIISVAGKCVLEQQKNIEPWSYISMEDYKTHKFVFREYTNLHANEDQYPGIAGKGSWGVAAIHPDYIRQHWCSLFDVKDIRACALNGQQDLVILIK